MLCTVELGIIYKGPQLWNPEILISAGQGCPREAPEKFMEGPEGEEICMTSASQGAGKRKRAETKVTSPWQLSFQTSRAAAGIKDTMGCCKSTKGLLPRKCQLWPEFGVHLETWVGQKSSWELISFLQSTQDLALCHTVTSARVWLGCSWPNMVHFRYYQRDHALG